jgi:hypothetical protein
MCLLIFKPAGKSVPSNFIHSAHRHNSDGAGIAYHTGKKVEVQKSPRWKGQDVIDALERVGNRPAIIHFRMATHGSVNRDNAHPFTLPHGYAAAHNGVIPGMDCLPDESDTRAFLRSHVAPFLTRKSDISESLVSLWEKEVGKSNKLAIMSPTGHVTLVNEEAGEWIDGVWYSNTYSLPSATRWTPSRGYKVPAIPSIMQWHEWPECSYCGSCVTSSFGTLEDGELICERCADLF